MSSSYDYLSDSYDPKSFEDIGPYTGCTRLVFCPWVSTRDSQGSWNGTKKPKYLLEHISENNWPILIIVILKRIKRHLVIYICALMWSLYSRAITMSPVTMGPKMYPKGTQCFPKIISESSRPNFTTQKPHKSMTVGRQQPWYWSSYLSIFQPNCQRPIY